MRAKRFISIILSILIVCSSFAGLTVFADEANKNERRKDVAPVGAEVSDKYSVADEAVQDQSGTTGDCKWTYEASTQTLTISGNGEMGNYDWKEDVPWYGFNTKINRVVIENGVTSIGGGAFYHCTSLTSVTIPDSVTSIGYSAFRGCENLIDVTIGNGVTSIRKDAFGDTAIYNNQPEGVVYIDNWLIDYKGYMPENTEIVIKNGTRGIADFAFSGCISLTSVTIPDSVTIVGYSAFSGCTSLTSVTIGNSVTSIGGSAFEDCTSLTSITIPDSVTSIGDYAFENCRSLTSVTIPDSVTSIGYSAFSSCTSLTSVTIPDSVTSIGNYAFLNCKNLNGVTIGNSVTSIGEYAFFDCTSLTSVTIPDSITSIGSYAFGYYVDYNYNKIKVQNFTIYGYNGTSAEKYAEDNEFNFVSLGTGKSVQNITGFQPKYEVEIGHSPIYLNASAKTTLSYTSDNTSVAEVSEDGLVTINGVGKATITITAEETTNYKSATATVEVTVGKASQDVTGFESKYEVTFGDNPFSLNAKAETALSYVSNNTSVADVLSDGTVTINGAGKATITITAEETGDYNSATATVKITVNKASQKVSVAEKEYELTYGAKPFNLGAKADTTLTYVSNNLNVAEVSADGTVTINGAGTANIIIIGEETDNYTSAITTVKIIVKKASQGVTGFEPKYEVTFGDNPFSLNAKAETALSYASDNTSVAEVSADGTVTIKGAGKATITITAEETANYNSTTATVKIIVNKTSPEITGFETNYNVKFGDNPFSLNAKAETALSYTSDNTSVAEVSTDGTVTINSAGKATITITAEETANYKSATATVEITVNKASQKVSIAEKEYELTYGAKPFNLGAKADTTLTYVSNNLNVAEVSADGTVTINGAGTANIIIMGEETDNYTSAITTVKIIVKKASQEVTGFESKYEVTFGDKPISLNAKAETELLYASDNTSVAEVSSNGTVTIKNSGTASIMIIAKETANYNSTTATVKIIVNKTSPEITGFETNYNVKFGDNTFSLNAKAETALSYASDNTSVAEVSADGTVTIKGAGKATITITAEETTNYKSATATVEVTVGKATQRVTGVKTQYVTSAGKSFILKPKAKTKLTYTSSNKNVAVVSSTGKVTVKAGGYAYITVKASENGNYKSAYVKTKIISAPRDFTSKDVSKVKKTGKTTAKITWKSLAGAKGYTVQLATNKSYKGAKTVKNSKNTATLTGLKKGKTYYVRISAYTKVSGKNYSNKWYTVKFKM